MTALLVCSVLALLAWLGVLVAPYQPHRLREWLDADDEASPDLSAVTVLIPARDEADVIGRTVSALAAQGRGLAAIVVDDQSSDGTGAAAMSAADDPAALVLRVLRGDALPAGWAGKLWALEQGQKLVDRPFVLLLDADIELEPKFVPTLLREALRRNASLVSIMAELHCTTFWERLLTPAFVFFFKLLYPFALSNDPRRRTAAAAGGCMLVRTDALRAIGGFAAIRGALIDDCTLAAALKRAAPPIWLGVSRSVRSLRAYPALGDFWAMVSRSAFTQLHYSNLLLLLTSALMLVLLLAPIAAVVVLPAGSATPRLVGAAAWLAMGAAYFPVVRFYRLSALWALTLPLAAALFLAMTWTSAFAYWRGSHGTWKSRSYDRSLARH
ncbi:MAG: glycosyltransferase [Gammaproteobacteria bacterium]